MRQKEKELLKQHFREDDFSSFSMFLLDNARQKKNFLVDFIKFCNNDDVFNSFWENMEINLNHEHSENRIIPRKKKMFKEALVLKIEFRDFTEDEKELLHYYNVAKRKILKKAMETWEKDLEAMRYELLYEEPAPWLDEEDPPCINEEEGEN